MRENVYLDWIGITTVNWQLHSWNISSYKLKKIVLQNAAQKVLNNK